MWAEARNSDVTATTSKATRILPADPITASKAAYDLQDWFAEQQSRHEDRIERILDTQHKEIIQAVIRAINIRSAHGQVSFNANTNQPTEFKSTEGVARRPDMDLRSAASSKVAVKQRQADINISSGITSSSTCGSKSIPSMSSTTMSGSVNGTIMASPATHPSQNSARKVFLSTLRKSASMKPFCDWAYEVTSSNRFEVTAAGLIVANAILVGAQAEWSMYHLAEPTPTAFIAVDWVLLLAFTLELVLRLLADGRIFFTMRSKSLGWNLFDTCLVAMSYMSKILNQVEWVAPDVTVFRIFRILRLVRVIRLMRVLRFFSFMRVMIVGIASSLKSLLWALILLFILKYVFAVCIVQTVAEELSNWQADMQTSGLFGSHMTTDVEASLSLYYGSLSRTIYTLFLSISGGIDWGNAADPLLAVSPIFGFLFTIYVAFVILCVLNIITGVFVENANKIITHDEDTVIRETLEARMRWISEVQTLFQEADADGNGSLAWPEFKDKLDDVRVLALFTKLGIDVESQSKRGLFLQFDLNGDGVIEIDEFATALQSVHGNARSIDLMVLKHENKLLKRNLKDLTEVCHQIAGSIDWHPKKKVRRPESLTAVAVARGDLTVEDVQDEDLYMRTMH